MEAKTDGAVGGSGGDGDGCEGEEDGEQDSDGDRGDSGDGDSETVSVASDSLIIFCVPGTGLKALYTSPPLNSHDLPVRWALPLSLSHSWGILGSQRASTLRVHTALQCRSRDVSQVLLDPGAHAVADVASPPSTT